MEIKVVLTNACTLLFMSSIHIAIFAMPKVTVSVFLYVCKSFFNLINSFEFIACDELLR